MAEVQAFRIAAAIEHAHTATPLIDSLGNAAYQAVEPTHSITSQ